MSLVEHIHARSEELTSLSGIISLVQWDQEVMMPARAAEGRAKQLAILSRIAHRKTIDPALGALLSEAEARGNGLAEKDRALVRVMRRAYDQNSRLPEDFVAELSSLTSRALQGWIEARRQSDFTIFQPLLTEIVAMNRRKAGYLGFKDKPYDALLDLYEEGLTTAALTTMFNNLQPHLVAMVERAKNMNWPQLEIKDDFALAGQVEFSEKILALIGYDFTRGRQDKSAHPFSTTISHHDRRVTNRFNPRSLEFIFSALHEGGHGLYEQGIAADLAGTSLDDGVSLGIHESQSRLWENIIGRSREFWSHVHPELARTFPRQFQDVDLDTFAARINTVAPGLIRVEADEISYNLHVIIRFQLERDLLDGSIEVNDLPPLWNRLYRDYLGVDVDSDANGVLQDIHWAHGSLGYFPTYTIGNLASAQFWHTYCKADPAWRQTITSGNFAKIRAWLTENIYRHGSVYPPETLLERVTGETLNSRYFIDYLNNKFQQYGL